MYLFSNEIKHYLVNHEKELHAWKLIIYYHYYIINRNNKATEVSLLMACMDIGSSVYRHIKDN